jgi:hypothetical protein
MITDDAVAWIRELKAEDGKDIWLIYQNGFALLRYRWPP